jgi:succinyl-CoA synthetase alpha subunit
MGAFEAKIKALQNAGATVVEKPDEVARALTGSLGKHYDIGRRHELL